MSTVHFNFTESRDFSALNPTITSVNVVGTFTKQNNIISATLLQNSIGTAVVQMEYPTAPLFKLVFALVDRLRHGKCKTILFYGIGQLIPIIETERDKIFPQVWEIYKQLKIDNLVADYLTSYKEDIAEFETLGLKPATIPEMVATVERLARCYDLDAPETYIDPNGQPFAYIDSYSPTFKACSKESTYYAPYRNDLVVSYGVTERITIPFSLHLTVQYLTIKYYQSQGIEPIYTEYIDADDNRLYLLPSELAEITA